MDVVDLRNFYAQRLGMVARRFISRGIRAHWSDTTSLRVVGIGYATPYLGLFREEADRCLALMPAPQGVVRWPSSKPALAALVEEDDLPLTDSAVDRVLLVHALENSSDPVSLLREVWRVLAGGGRLLAVVPNRRGLWARMDTTPFGHGRPYSRPQITHLLREPGSPRPAGAKRYTCRQSRAAGSCAQRSRGSAPARRSRPRSPACISSKPPSRFTAPFRRGANAAVCPGAPAGARSVAGRRRAALTRNPGSRRRTYAL